VKNVIITGAAGGMGSKVLEVLSRREVNALCVDLDEDRVRKVIDGLGGTVGQLVPYGGDVSEEGVVEAYTADAAARWDGLDGVFHTHGIEGDLNLLVEATTEDFDRVWKVNARSIFFGMKYAVPYLRERGGGSIVSTGSYLAVRGNVACGTYGASKHAIVCLTRTLALEVAEDEINVNVVCPGSMDTRMIRELYPTISDDPAEAEAAIVSVIPQKRLARPEELASTGVWLLLDAPSHLTGQVIMVDGGRFAD